MKKYCLLDRTQISLLPTVKDRRELISRNSSAPTRLKAGGEIKPNNWILMEIFIISITLQSPYECMWAAMIQKTDPQAIADQ